LCRIYHPCKRIALRSVSSLGTCHFVGGNVGCLQRTHCVRTCDRLIGNAAVSVPKIVQPDVLPNLRIWKMLLLCEGEIYGLAVACPGLVHRMGDGTNDTVFEH
jgi:hypothetical protein